MTNMWGCPGNIAAAGGPAGLRFRNAFLGTVAAGALSLAFGGQSLAGPVPVGCTFDVTGTIETCTGNQSAGVTAAPAPVTTLNVNSLTAAITPASGTSGISFISAGTATITSNTGAFVITTSNASGIVAASTGGPVTVTSTGNITTAGNNAFGIDAGSTGGPVTVTSTGNITSAGNYARGIRAFSTGGPVTVTRPATSPPRATTRTGLLP
jgi:hypothetical protein